MRFHMLHPRDQLVAIMDRIYRNGMTTLSGGNLSIRDDDDSIWITPAGVDKGKLTPKDIICIRPDGTAIGPHRPSSELPFHRAIFTRRPDLRAIVHAHAPALVSFSIARQTPNTSIIPQARRVCGVVGYAPYAVPASEALGESIANTFAEGYNVVLLENHGIATGGLSLLDAYHRLETLDFCARTQLKAMGLGAISSLTETQLLPFDVQYNLLPEFRHETFSSRERELRQEIVEIVHRAVERYLMISTEGVVSARVDADSFLITPTGCDRGSVEIEDLVLIREGRREGGKLPSRSVRLHRAIYQAHPTANCIITAQSPNVTAYAISEDALRHPHHPRVVRAAARHPGDPLRHAVPRTGARGGRAFAGHPGAADPERRGDDDRLDHPEGLRPPGGGRVQRQSAARHRHDRPPRPDRRRGYRRPEESI